MRDTTPLISPLGDQALTVSFSDRLSLRANGRALAAAKALVDARLAGVVEVVPNLVSVYVGYDPQAVGFTRMSGEVALVLSNDASDFVPGVEVAVETAYGGDGGPDLEEVAARVSMTPSEFTARHGAAPLRVLAAGFAPGFVYCGLHEDAMVVPRRSAIQRVPAGAVLFAAGQTALSATPVRTGWWWIGRTDFSGFDPKRMPPTVLLAGTPVRFPGVGDG